jgi:DnaJ-class molecular chaperone
MSIIILIVVVVALGYYLSLRVHPTTRCKRCDSSTRHYDLVYSERRRGSCPDCRGTGRRERFGVRFFR